MNATESIQTEPQADCPVCAAPGDIAYRDLPDRLFGSPGRWTLRRCADAACGVFWLDPRPTLADVGKLYRNYYTHGHGQSPLIRRMVRGLAREIADLHYGFAPSGRPWPLKYLASLGASLYPGLRDHLDLQIRYMRASSMGQGQLLDVGCGDGEALEILRDLGWQVCGVEFDPQAVATARAHALDVRQGSLADAAFADDSFDAITLSHVIEHLHDPRALLVESLRVLRKGGTLVAVTPNVNSRSHQRYGPKWRDLDPPRHLVVFTMQSLRDLALSAGLKDVQVRTTARAVALAEITGLGLRDEEYYRDDGRPGLATWVRAQTRQLIETLRTTPDDPHGNELVLTATKQ